MLLQTQVFHLGARLAHVTLRFVRLALCANVVLGFEVATLRGGVSSSLLAVGGFSRCASHGGARKLVATRIHHHYSPHD